MCLYPDELTQEGWETLLSSHFLSNFWVISWHIFWRVQLQAYFVCYHFWANTFLFLHITYISMPTIYWWCMWMQKGITTRIKTFPDCFFFPVGICSLYLTTHNIFYQHCCHYLLLLSLHLFLFPCPVFTSDKAHTAPHGVCCFCCRTLGTWP